jgi:hypothetical protein
MQKPKDLTKDLIIIIEIYGLNEKCCKITNVISYETECFLLICSHFKLSFNFHTSIQLTPKSPSNNPVLK